MAVEWVRVDDHVVVATDRRAWLQPWPSATFAAPMAGDGTAASTANLLDGILAAAARAAVPAPPPPALNPERWAWRLIGAYTTTSATPRLMREAGSRVARNGRHRLAAHCRAVAQEEDGHDRLALRDLAALGYDAPALVTDVVHPTAAALVAYFENTVRSPHPVSCLGYAYALERRASVVPRDYVEAVERVLPRGVRATRCLRVHSSIGSDGRHVAEAVEVIAGLPPADRRRVATACYETARLLSSPPPGSLVDDEALGSLLSPYQTKGVVSWRRT